MRNRWGTVGARQDMPGVLNKGREMSNRTALVVAILITNAILLDVTLNGSKAVTFLLRKLVDMIDYLEFWR